MLEMGNIFRTIGLTVALIVVVVAILAFLSQSTEYERCKSLPNDDVADHPAPNRGHASSQAECLYDLGVSTLNVSICKEINFTDSYWYKTFNYRASCAAQIASATRNKSVCYGLDGKDLQEDCVTRYHYTTHDYSDDPVYLGCRGLSNESYCDRYGNCPLSNQSSCLYDLAQNRSDVVLCNEITAQTMMGGWQKGDSGCVALIALSKNDTELCDLANDPVACRDWYNAGAGHG